jgi:type II secretory ATPase GspE/PulE/Tfp pilus assembly ATPase PilB-like protein
MSQRLLRSLCPACKSPAQLSDSAKSVIERLGAAYGISTTGQVFKAVGCLKCSAGYLGRFGVIEALEMTPDVQEVVASERSSLVDVAKAAAKAPPALRADTLDDDPSRPTYQPMILDGLRHVLAGETSEAELLRELAYEDLLL